MKFRVARHTNNLSKIIDFYHGVIGLSILASFEDHDNYSGVFLGLVGEKWHLEFTQSDEITNHIPDEDDILVFYQDSYDAYQNLVEKVKANNIESINSKNPYWNKNGTCFKDPDGFNIIISYQEILSI